MQAILRSSYYAPGPILPDNPPPELNIEAILTGGDIWDPPSLFQGNRKFENTVYREPDHFRLIHLTKPGKKYLWQITKLFNLESL